MNKKIMLLIFAIVLITSMILCIFIFSHKEEPQIEQKISNIDISEDIEDECTEEYVEQETLKTVTSQAEKISANAEFILKKYFAKCEHTINEYAELPQEVVNMTKEEVEKQYPDWKVIGFEPNKLILYREFEGECGEHFRLKIEDGKISIYLINSDGTETLYEKTEISSEYLPEADLMNMQDGLDIYGKEELNQIIEDFE